MPAVQCRAAGCTRPGGYRDALCFDHFGEQFRRDNPGHLEVLRASADPARHAVTRAAVTAPPQVTPTRPAALVLACPGCGGRHQVPTAALDAFPCLMPCGTGTWLKPALVVSGAA